MNNYALWITHEMATIYKFTPTGFEERQVHQDGYIDHHNGNLNDRKDKRYEHFYHKIAGELKDANGLFVMGPGVAKLEFCHHCLEHHHDEISKAITHVKTMSTHPSKNEILKEAENYFSF